MPYDYRPFPYTAPPGMTGLEPRHKVAIVGAGGIGLALADRIRINDWDQVCFIVLMILVTVSIIDVVSRALREKLVGKQALAG
jgi:hypothetical protein